MSVRDARKAGFVWASTDALAHLRKVWNGGRSGPDQVGSATGLGVYHALTEIANDDKARTVIRGDSEMFRTSRKEIAERAGGVSSRSVARACAELERIGLLVIEADRDGANRPGRPSFYILVEPDQTWDTSSDVARSERRTPVPTPSDTSSDVPRKGGTPVRTSLYKEKKNSKEEEEEQTVDPVVELYEFWKAETRRNGSTKLTPNRRAAVKARLAEGRDPAYIRRAIANAAASPFHQGKNDRGRRFDDLTLICRNGEKLEQFAEMGDGESTLSPAEPPPGPPPTGPILNADRARSRWDAARAKLAAALPDPTMQLWVDPFEAGGERGGVLVLVDSTDQGGAGTWATRRYKQLFLEALDHAYDDIQFVDETELEMEAR